MTQLHCHNFIVTTSFSQCYYYNAIMINTLWHSHHHILKTKKKIENKVLKKKWIFWNHRQIICSLKKKNWKKKLKKRIHNHIITITLSQSHYHNHIITITLSQIHYQKYIIKNPLSQIHYEILKKKFEKKKLKKQNWKKNKI